MWPSSGRFALPCYQRQPSLKEQIGFSDTRSAQTEPNPHNCGPIRVGSARTDADFPIFPCNFPVYQGNYSGDGLEQDYVHSQFYDIGAVPSRYIARLICGRPQRSKRIFGRLTRSRVLTSVRPFVRHFQMPLARMGVRGPAPYQDYVLSRHIEPIWFCRPRLIDRCAVPSFRPLLLRQPHTAVPFRQRRRELCKPHSWPEAPTRCAPSCWRAP
jgi:hypothetical protein